MMETILASLTLMKMILMMRSRGSERSESGPQKRSDDFVMLNMLGFNTTCNFSVTG
jgi:hypothetical protein